jgi:hypothetical protein
MTLQRKLVFGVVGWLAGVTALHLWLNTDLLNRASRPLDPGSVRFRVGFLPVT